MGGGGGLSEKPAVTPALYDILNLSRRCGSLIGDFA